MMDLMMVTVALLFIVLYFVSSRYNHKRPSHNNLEKLTGLCCVISNHRHDQQSTPIDWPILLRQALTKHGYLTMLKTQ